MNDSDFPTIRDGRLRRALMDLLFEQENKVARMAFLAPDVNHVFRVAANARQLAENKTFRSRLHGPLGPDAARVVALGALLSKIGFAHPELRPEESATLFRNRIFALELLAPLKDALREELALDEAGYRVFLEALLRQGTFGVGTRDAVDQLRAEVSADGRLAAALRSHGMDGADLSPVKYANPLTGLLTLASEIDIGRTRLQDWQLNETIMKVLLAISADPALATLEIEKFALDSQLARSRSTIAAHLREGGSSEAETLHAHLAHLEGQIRENRLRFKEELGKLVRREFMDEEVSIQRQLQVHGASPDEANALFRRAASCIAGITSESYLWYVASNSIASIDVGADRSSLVVCQTDHADIFGNAASLPHIRNFHLDRLTNLVRQVNAALGCDLRLERRVVKRNQDLWDRCEELFKGDTHMHLKMSVMASRVWESLIGPQLDVYEKVFDESQRLLNRLRQKRNLPANIDLKQMFAEANHRANALFGFTRKHRTDYRWPESKDELAQEARSTAGSLGERLPAGERDLLDDDIRLYYMLKFQVTKLFSFTDGALPDFVDHFTAISKLLSKVSVTDESSTLKSLTHNMLLDASRHGVWYVEPRFNIGKSFEGTLQEVLLVLQAYRELQDANPGLPAPLVKIILSITKFGDQDKTVAERIRHKDASAAIFVRILRDAQQRWLAGNQPYEGLGENFPVTPRDVLLHVGGMDAAGQEEFNPPELFYAAFHQVDAYNKQLAEFQEMARTVGGEPLKIAAVGMTFHVSESVSDVSIESGIRHLFEALWMKPFPEVVDGDVPLLTRVGHAIVVALTDYDQLHGTTCKESLAERLRQIEFDRKLCRMGVPLLSVTEEGLHAEQHDLVRYQALQAASGAHGADRELTDIAARWGIDSAGNVVYGYDEEEVIDLETRAGLARDCLIRHGIVVETNPTSNVGVSPYIDRYEEHTLRTYLRYEYFAWSRNKRLASALERRAAGANRAEAARARELQRQVLEFQKQALAHHGQKVRVTINTDDGTLFGVTLIDEYYRIALAMKWSLADLKRLADESLESAIQPLPPEAVHALRRRAGGQPVQLRPPTRSLGGLNELIVQKLKTCAEQSELTSADPPILSEGAAEDGCFYLVVSGSVVVQVRGRQVATLRNNEIFGEMARAGAIRSATVTAGPGGVRLLKIHKAEFLRLCSHNRTVRQYFEDLIASRDTSGSFEGFDAHFAVCAAAE